MKPGKSKLLAIATAAMVAPVALASAETVVIRGARVYVAPANAIDGATVVIGDGLVRQVGKNVRAPAGARVIDASGKVVTAGLVESATTLGLTEVSLEPATRDGSFVDGAGKDAIHAAYRVSDGYNAASVAIPIARAQGVTAAVPVPRGGLVSGTSAWFALADPVAGNAVAVADPVAMHAYLGESAMASAQGSRGMAILRLREVLDDARAFSRTRRNYDRNQSRALAAGRLDLAALAPVAAGRVPLVVHAHRRSDIAAALRLANDLGLRLVISGATESWMIAKNLSQAGVGVILNPVANLPDFERIHVRDDAAKILAEAGVDVAISSLGPPWAAGQLRQLAGNAVAHGMSYEAALAAVTTVPARLYGIDRGTIAAGKVADLVVWSGDPFELSTRAEHVFIAGKEQSTTNRQSLLRDRYRTLGK